MIMLAGIAMFLLMTLALLVWHESYVVVLVEMAVAGLGGGLTFASLAMLMVPHLPAADVGRAMAFNQVLRFSGFALGSALSATLLVGLGRMGRPDDASFSATLVVLSAFWLVSALLIGGVGGVGGIGRNRALPLARQQVPEALLAPGAP